MNWFKRIVFVFLFLKALGLMAQSKAYTSIQASTNNYPNKDFYFQKVIDARENKASIGWLYKSDLRVKHSAQFKHPLADELGTFLKTTYSNKTSTNKIVLLVNDFEIDHLKHENSKDEGLAKVNFDFYLMKGDSCFLIQQYSEHLQELSDEPSLSQPNRIKRVLLKAVGEMEKDMLKFKPNINAKPIHYDSLQHKGIAITKKDNKKNQAASIPNYYFFQTGIYYSFSGQVMLLGITTNMVLQIKKHPQYLIGANINLNLYGIKTSELTESPPSTSILNYDFGIKILKQISPQIFININPQVVLGRTQKNVTSITVPPVTPTPSYPVESFMGIEVDFGAYLIPPQLPGLYTGLNVFYRSTSSSIFEEGAGIKLDLGYKF